MKVTIEVQSTKDPVECLEANIKTQNKAIDEQDDKTEKFRLLGTVNILNKILAEIK